MSRRRDYAPRLLDLFCGAGGCSVGYARAGFDVVGVDINPQPRYPFEFHQADALTFPLDGFDAIHASPPCQDHSPLAALVGLHGTGWVLDHTAARMMEQPAPWVIENVAGAKMRADLTLCGGMFGLRTYRHRKFTLDPRIGQLLAVPAHPRHIARTSTKKRRVGFDAGMHVSITGDVGSWLGPACMGIDWMTGDELSQAIPPAYTEFVGQQLLAHIEGVAG
jgi:DNA (cytosine-5)-methyltransferase 1